MSIESLGMTEEDDQEMMFALRASIKGFRESVHQIDSGGDLVLMALQSGFWDGWKAAWEHLHK